MNTILLYTAVSLILYIVACNRLLYLVQPLRIELAYLGEELLSRKDLAESEKGFIEFSLNNAYNRLLAWTAAIAFTPVVLFIALERLRAFVNHDRHAYELRTPRDVDLARFRRLSLYSTMATSPIAATIFGVQFMFWFALFFPVGKSIRSTIEIAEQILIRYLDHYVEAKSDSLTNGGNHTAGT